MPAVLAQSALEANLSALKVHNGELAHQLASVRPAPTIEFDDTPDGVPTARYDGRPMCSRHRPLEEARRLADGVDLIENAVVVVLGFGLGYHVRRLAERMAKAGVIVVFEPDVPLLRAALEHVDHSAWLRDSAVIFATVPDDRALLATKLNGLESLVAQGVVFMEHAASRGRLGGQAGAFGTTFSEFVNGAKTTMVTTLMRSVDTVRNLLLNLDHYVTGPGITDLAGAAAGRLGVVVSAGPSLRQNVDRLALPGVRDRCVIVAVQTTLKPLLEHGVKPHYVTALDYHEISRRFYEDLEAYDLSDVTLITDPKAHPVIIDAYPGPVRCCGNGFLDRVLGRCSRDMGALAAGATVAHLALYVARHLGCNPIAMIGQDLGFTDGLYYTPGTAIHDVWAPELNPFNTIEMMEWQRIARHRLHLHETVDVHGRSIFTDAQMLTYLQQFERDFAACEREGVEVIDATEGGVAKQHTIPRPLAEVLAACAGDNAAPITLPEPGAAGALRPVPDAIRERVAEVRHTIVELQRIAGTTTGLLERMLDEQDPERLARHFARLDGLRAEVDSRFEAFEIINTLNQMGMFKRFKADRRLQMSDQLTPAERQRAQLDRDLENVRWIGDAAREMNTLLADCEGVLRGERVDPVRSRITTGKANAGNNHGRVAALVPIDPQANGLGWKRSLAEDIGGRTVLQATLERVGRSATLDRIILIAPRSFEIDPLIDRDAIALPVDIERCETNPYGPGHEAVAAARRWSDTCWRGGVAGMSVYDEVFSPEVMSGIVARHGVAAALLVGPDWPLVDVEGAEGCDAIVRRFGECPQQNIVFTQAPPGLCGCLITAALLEQLGRDRNRLATIGGLLVYQPHAPQGDPIARDANVQLDHRVRRSLTRATYDSARQRRYLRAALPDPRDWPKLTSAEIAARLETHVDLECADLPRHIVVELCTDRSSTGVLASPVSRPQLTRDLLERILEPLADADDIAVTFAGAGDPLHHEDFDDLVRLAKQRGASGVHVRTELLADRATIEPARAERRGGRERRFARGSRGNLPQDDGVRSVP